MGFYHKAFILFMRLTALEASDRAAQLSMVTTRGSAAFTNPLSNDGAD